MSTILEALKRSERERKLNDVPKLADMPAIVEPSPFKWVLLTVSAVLAVALITALLVFAFNSQSTTQVPFTGSTSDLSVRADALPDLSVISYSENPSQRFAMINNKLLREGDFLAAGIKVEHILSDQVVIILNGDRIVLKP